MSTKKILVVDDSRFDRELLAKVLEKKGKFEVLQAENGNQCIDIIGKQQLDLVLMDIMMPGNQGSNVLRMIREKSNPIELPIIMVTSKGDTADIISCLQSGANDYITKPVNYEVVMSRISTHLNLAETSREMGRLQEVAALHAMVATYNHEINNPLSIAIGSLSKLESTPGDLDIIKTAEQAMWRISEIVKKIKEVTAKTNVQYKPYANSKKLIKVK